MRQNQYPLLNSGWTIKGSGGKFLLYDFKHGLSEERYSLSEIAYNVLRMSDGAHTLKEIDSIVGCDPKPYYRYLQKIEPEIIVLSDKKQQPREFTPERQGDNFLGRVLWHITGQCNCDCKHCYMATTDWEDLPWPDAESLIDQLIKMNVYAISLTGGEPLIHPHFIEIVQALDQNEIKIEGIFTNATLLSEKMIATIENTQIIPFFVSINGPRDVPHDSFMGKDGGFQLTIDNLRSAIKMQVPVFANTILSTLVEDGTKIREFYELVRDLGILRWRVSVPFLEGNWLENHQTLSISLEKEIQIYKQILEMWLSDGKPLELELGHAFRYINGQIVQTTYGENDYVCDYFRERIVILPDGSVVPCSLLIHPPFILGNTQKQTLEEIWESPQTRWYKDLKVRDVMVDKCKACKSLSKCGVGCRANAVLLGKPYSDIDDYACTVYQNNMFSEIELFLETNGLT